MSYVKIGVAGPVGSGKTALIEALSRKMAKDYSIGVITNDIYTKEDAQFLAKNSVLPVERIIGVETGVSRILNCSLSRAAEITFPQPSARNW